MRKNNTQKLDEVISEVLKDLNLDIRLKETRLINSWPDVVGKTVARFTTNLYIKNKILFVQLSSSVVRQELTMVRDGLVKTLNDKVGDRIIEKIVLR